MSLPDTVVEIVPCPRCGKDMDLWLNKRSGPCRMCSVELKRIERIKRYR